MSVSKEERQAYEDGLKEGNYISEHRIAYLLTGTLMMPEGVSRPRDPHLASLYDKGVKREQLDD